MEKSIEDKPLLEDEQTHELIVVDVHKYRQVKEALRESTERYKILFDNIPLGIYRTTPSGRFLEANKALIQMLGFQSFEELCQHNLEKEGYLLPSTRRQFQRKIERDGEIKGFEAIWLRRDSAHIWIRENAKLVRNASGQALYYEGTVEDITEFKNIEQKINKRTRNLEVISRLSQVGNQSSAIHTLLDNIIDSVIELIGMEGAAIFLFAEQGKIVETYTAKGLPEDFLELMKKDKICTGPHSELFLQGNAVYCENFNAIHPEAYERWGLLVAGSIPLMAKNRVIGVLNVASKQRYIFSQEEKEILELIAREAGTFITKILIEEALRESEELYRTLVATSPDAIALFDLKSKLLMVNPHFRTLFNYRSAEEVLGKNGFEFIVPEERAKVRKLTQALLQKGEITNSEFTCLRSDGSRFPQEISAAALRDAHGKICAVVCIGRDITERKKAEEMVLQYQEKLRSLTAELTLTEERERRKIAADLHDHIGQKLVFSKMKLELLQKAAAEVKQCQALEEIRLVLEETIQDTRSLIFEISPPILYELGFAAAVEWLADSLQQQYSLRIEVTNSLKSEVLEDNLKILLFQIMRELLLNIVKHAKARQAKVNINGGEKNITIIVADDGQGFETAAYFANKNPQGFGIFSIRERLRHYSGEISINSTPGQGTRISLTVPNKSERQTATMKNSARQR